VQVRWNDATFAIYVRQTEAGSCDAAYSHLSAIYRASFRTRGWATDIDSLDLLTSSNRCPHNNETGQENLTSLHLLTILSVSFSIVSQHPEIPWDLITLGFCLQHKTKIHSRRRVWSSEDNYRRLHLLENPKSHVTVRYYLNTDYNIGSSRRNMSIT
jgi:hypothetical protein